MARSAAKRAARRAHQPALDAGRRTRDLSQTLLELQRQNRDLRASLKRRQRDGHVDLFDFAPITYVLLDSIGLIREINPVGTRMLGAAREHLVGHPLLARVYVEDRRVFLDHLYRCRTSADMIETGLRFSPEGGGQVCCRLYSRRTAGSDDALIPTMIADVTSLLEAQEARRLAERSLEQSELARQLAFDRNAAKDEFLAMVSHELRTPLTPALVAASRLAAAPEIEERFKKLASTIKRNIEFEGSLIDQLLDIARIGRNRLELQLETVDLHQVLRETVNVCLPAAQAKGIDVRLSLRAYDHHVLGDSARLRQVFWNLLGNAVKFTGEGGAVSIESDVAHGKHVRMSVCDNGEGMTPGVLASLFSPLDHARPIRSRSSRGGLGLGLVISQGIVSAHGGTLVAESRGPGQGATFTVELATRAVGAEPVGVNGDGDQRPASSNDESRGAGNRRRVLIVEDDTDTADMLDLFFSQHGFEVHVASSLAAAVKRLDEGWDFVLSDLGLPDGSGLQLGGHVKRLARPPAKLIALTGFGSINDIRASRDAGFAEHLVKPIDLDKLLEMLNGSLNPEAATA
jgi:PAS domain S-box-containing protein